jgi:hypothetical protein
MSKVLKEYFGNVRSSDAYEYGYGETFDFLGAATNEQCDWIITNPPFRLAEDFILKSLRLARRGVAVLARSVFLESIGRYQGIFQKLPPTKFAQFAERVPMVKGRLDRKASTATGYAWFVWELDKKETCRLMWVPPCRRSFERDDDYANPVTDRIVKPTNWALVT